MVVSPFVVFLVEGTGETFSTVGTFEGTIFCVSASMKFEIVPFVEVFVPAIDWALVQNI